jgi:hypothetical protein
VSSADFINFASQQFSLSFFSGKGLADWGLPHKKALVDPGCI